MRIGIVGSGISGMLVARMLSSRHQVRLFEANPTLGGHTHTAKFSAFGKEYDVDTGFMVFNHRTYPNFCRMLELLQVPARETDMSFSVRCERTGLEYQGSSLNGLFAQRSNLLSPRFYGLIRDVLRFNWSAPNCLNDSDPKLSLGEYLKKHRYGSAFVEQYLLPMAAAIWSTPPEEIRNSPACFLIRFFQNHGLLQIANRPQWMTVQGGAQNYIDALMAPIRHCVRLSSPVRRVIRTSDFVYVEPSDAPAEQFDRVVMATHADTTLRLLDEPTDDERRVLSAFPYQANDVVLHTDRRLLPKRERAWASWNYNVRVDRNRPATLTYNLNRLQGHESPAPICITLNDTDRIDPRRIVRKYVYHHPVFTPESIDAQAAWERIDGRNRTHFCGAYWGYGFHEDGVNSALAVTRKFNLNDLCTVVSTPVTSSTAERVPCITSSGTRL